MEKFCKDLRTHAMKIINYEQKEMMQLIDEENKSYEEQKVTYAKKNLVLMMMIKMEYLEELLIIFVI